MPEEQQQLARIAAVLDDTDKLVDKLFRNVAELKEILARSALAPPEAKEAGR